MFLSYVGELFSEGCRFAETAFARVLHQPSIACFLRHVIQGRALQLPENSDLPVHCKVRKDRTSYFFCSPFVDLIFIHFLTNSAVSSAVFPFSAAGNKFNMLQCFKYLLFTLV